MKGFVTIAGAGPGEIDHITVAALRAIHSAEVILYDALVRPSLIAEFPGNAETIFVGKRCGSHAYTQTMIIAAMIQHALAGRHVVRLKGGDPSIFAHLTSEISALSGLNIPYKILPGVSAMQSAAAELGRPLTLRQSARHVWVTDGHAADLSLNAAKMAVFPGTLVFYMGSGRTAEISRLLLENGLNRETAASLVENAGSAEAKTQNGTVADFAAGQFNRLTQGPGIFLIGAAISHEPDSGSEAAAESYASAP
ncbi:MAG: uroporphyrinogen-III C-methyltransferase [Turneriella sp.]